MCYPARRKKRAAFSGSEREKRKSGRRLKTIKDSAAYLIFAALLPYGQEACLMSGPTP
jgi:hypothetical protein